jgi:hypothetical protein
MSRFPKVAAALLALAAAACNTDNTSPIGIIAGPLSQMEANTFAPPSGTVTVAGNKGVWSYTSTGFSTTPQDPINLVFTGAAADPRQIRQILLGLAGSGRPGPLASFTCTWSDAVGDPQTGYGVENGWVGSAIQMQCGNFYGPRFHIRMFRVGNMTIANAHYEILIPGTNTHEVLSWELAQGLVTADLARSGRLASAPGVTDVINSAPFYRAVQPAVAALLPAPQIAALGLQVYGDGSASIPNDGRASVLDVGSAPALGEGLVDSDFVITFGQVIPKPFCAAGTTGYLYATGPINVHMRSGIVDGNFESTITSTGTLNLVEFNPITHQPASAPYQGVVSEATSGKMTNGASWADFNSSRAETPDNGVTRGTRTEVLRAREHGNESYNVNVSC